jgi:cytoskeletal protein RodZ
MSRRAKLLILALLAVLLIILVVILAFRFVRSRPAPETESAAEATETETPPSSLSSEAEVKAEQEERTRTASVQTVVKTFVERYGSFSTEANYANLRDVLPLMTGSLEAEARATLANPPVPTEYYGVTTRVVAVNVEKMDEAAGTASVTVSTQREEAKGSPQNISVKYQSITLTLRKIAGEWRVASATWLET